MTELEDKYVSYNEKKQNLDALEIEIDEFYKTLKDMKTLYSLYNLGTTEVNLIEERDAEGNVVATNQAIFDLWQNRSDLISTYIANIGLSQTEYIDIVSGNYGTHSIILQGEVVYKSKLEEFQNLYAELKDLEEEITQLVLQEKSIEF